MENSSKSSTYKIKKKVMIYFPRVVLRVESTEKRQVIFTCLWYCKIDTQLNQIKRTISGTIKSTPTYWLPTLSNIATPHLKCKHAPTREFLNILEVPELPIHQDTNDLDINRLRSRHSTVILARDLLNSGFQLTD